MHCLIRALVLSSDIECARSVSLPRVSTSYGGMENVRAFPPGRDGLETLSKRRRGSVAAGRDSSCGGSGGKGFRSFIVKHMVHLNTRIPFGHRTKLEHVIQLPVLNSMGPRESFLGVNGWARGLGWG